MKVLLNAVIFILLVNFSAGGQIYVDITATGANDGSSWINAFTDLQDALTIATAADEIWVANGTYKPLSCNPCTPADLEVTFIIPSGVALYGGFAGNESDLAQRDWETNQTILSGNIGDQADSTDNLYNVLKAINVNDQTILDGFVVEDGFADGSVGFFAGGGLLVDARNSGQGNIQVRNCTFRRNYAGGGGAVAIDCTLGGESLAVFRNCLFEGNTASLRVVSSGAAVFIQGNSGAQIAPRFIGCTFKDNFCGNDGGAFSATPTGEGTFLAFEIDSCLFVNNRAADRGGAVWYRMSSGGESKVVIKNSQFLSNLSGGQGGAIFARSSFDNVANDLLINCLFSENVTDGSSNVNDGEGGAVFLRGSQNGTRNHQIVNCVFDRNSAAQRGGAVATTSFVSQAGTLEADLINCSFYGNSTQGDGGAIHTAGVQGVNNLNITNSILWNNQAQGAENEIFNNSANINISFTNVTGGLPATVNDLGNNLSVEPNFADPENGDLHLLANSPLIDQGNNAAIESIAGTDLDGDPRIHQGVVDLGVYEIGVIYVDQNASGANNGNSWANAFNDLQDGLAVAMPGDQIWVADATYLPVNCNPCTPSDLEVTFNIPSGVALYGGFAGNESDLAQRDWETYQTILSGNIGDQADSTDNLYNVLKAINVNDQTILDGFVVEDGFADGSVGFFAGGGLLVDARNSGQGNIQVRNCTFRRNYAGGGGAVAIDCTLGGESLAVFRNCLFEGNTASLRVVSSGAAVFIQGNSGAQIAPRFIGCTFKDNFCGNDGGAFSATPTGEGTFLAFEIDSCLFVNNRAADRGGAVWYRMSSGGESKVVIKNSQFLSNLSGGQGGAIFARSSFDNVANDLLINCLFSENVTDGSSNVNDGEGGAVFLRGSQNGTRNHQIVNCVFDRNNAAQRGGAVATTSFVSQAGTLEADLINCSFYGNITQGDGGAIHMAGVQGVNNLNITNSILWGNQAQGVENEIFNNQGLVSISYSIIAGGLNPGLSDQGNNLTEDPKFYDPEAQDFRLLGCSPAINTGFNTTLPPDRADLDQDQDLVEQIDLDLQLNDRIFENIVDMGAIEWTGSPTRFDSLIFDPVQAAEEGLCNGSVQVKPFNGTPGYTFSWSNNETSALISDLCPGTYSVTVTDTFNCAVTDSVVIDEINVNDAPEFTSDPLLMVFEDSLYTYEIITSDPDPGDKFSVDASILPGWLTLTNTNNGEAILTGTPANEDVGFHDVTLTVADTSGLSSEQTFQIEVVNTNDPPVFDSTPVTEAAEGSLYQYDINTSDPDIGDQVIITADGALPNWLTLVDNQDGTAVLSGTPPNEDVGSIDITLVVSDQEGATDMQTFTIEVTNENQPPVFTSDPLEEATENQLYEYNITTTDPDQQDLVTITGSELPVWLQLNDNGDGTAVLTGTPANQDVGTVNVVLTVTDQSNLSNEQTFQIEVLNVNDPPAFNSTPVTEVAEASLYQYAISATDPDVGDQLAITFDGSLPNWLTLMDNQDGTAALSGTPANEDVGSIDVTLVVTDQAGETASQTFTIEVINENQPPFFTSDPVEEATEGQPYVYDIQATDPDPGEQLVITISSLPDWLTFTDQGDGSATLQGTPAGANLNDVSIQLTVTDQNGASNQQNFTVVVTILNNPPEIISLPVTIATADQFYIYRIEMNDQDPEDKLHIVALDIPPWLTLEQQNNEQASLSGVAPEQAGREFTVILQVTDEAGQVITQEFIITVMAEENVVFQNSITPNGDGLNDTWRIEGLDGCSDCSVEIYNRWGNKVFSSIGYQREWDGIFQGETLATGTYYYVIKLSSDESPITGSVSILK